MARGFQGRGREGRVKALPFLLALSATACAASGPSAPDMTPIGDGLKVIGFSLIGVAVVFTVGLMFRHPPSS